MCVSVSEYCDTQKTQVKKTGLEASGEIKHFHLKQPGLLPSRRTQRTRTCNHKQSKVLGYWINMLKFFMHSWFAKLCFLSRLQNSQLDEAVCPYLVSFFVFFFLLSYHLYLVEGTHIINFLIFLWDYFKQIEAICMHAILMRAHVCERERERDHRDN